jgi:hypothetical protein
LCGRGTRHHKSSKKPGDQKFACAELHSSPPSKRMGG